MNFSVKILTLAIISVILYFGMIIAYEHPLGGITGYTPSDNNNSLSNITSFYILVLVILVLLFIAWRRHQRFNKNRKA